MSVIELVMPKMGESIMEATILKWEKQVGDHVELDETILEIATDKVDTEIPSPVQGKIVELRYKVNDVVPVGQVIALIESVGSGVSASLVEGIQDIAPTSVEEIRPVDQISTTATQTLSAEKVNQDISSSKGRFYSPLVKNIANSEGIALQELDALVGSGNDGRLTKDDLLRHIEQRKMPKAQTKNQESVTKHIDSTISTPLAVQSGEDEIIEMDRMRKLIADHMVMSKHVSPHVTSFVEVDVTNIVNWRNKVKERFEAQYSEKITYTPIFIEAVTRAIRDFPLINSSLNGTQITQKKNINIGMATALPSGNLIVPVIKQADRYNLVGLTKMVNELASKARGNKLKPEEIQDGTFTLTNVGTFGNVMGTPIINQPQVAILAIGAIRKKPAVLETEYGDVIGIRQMMFLSLSYDHRIIDGFLGGSFLRKVGDYLEAFDYNRSI